MRPPPILLCILLLTGSLHEARADSHAVTIVNTTSETIRRIEIGNAENRLRSTLPHGAQASITYSTGCQADVRLAFDSGRTETFAAVDVCSNPRIVTGQGVVGTGPPPATTTAAATATPAGTKPGAKPINTPAMAPPPVVPPWTGKSITKRFGGME